MPLRECVARSGYFAAGCESCAVGVGYCGVNNGNLFLNSRIECRLRRGSRYRAYEVCAVRYKALCDCRAVAGIEACVLVVDLDVLAVLEAFLLESFDESLTAVVE